jgi:hypothetical protein
MRLYRTMVAVILVFCYLVCAPVCSCASNKPVMQLLVCVLRRVLMNVPGRGVISFKGTESVEKFKFTG